MVRVFTRHITKRADVLGRTQPCQAGRLSTEGRTGVAACIGGPNHVRILMVERLPLSATAIVRLGGVAVNAGPRIRSVTFRR